MSSSTSAHADCSFAIATCSAGSVVPLSDERYVGAVSRSERSLRASPLLIRSTMMLKLASTDGPRPILRATRSSCDEAGCTAARRCFGSLRLAIWPRCSSGSAAAAADADDAARAAAAADDSDRASAADMSAGLCLPVQAAPRCPTLKLKGFTSPYVPAQDGQNSWPMADDVARGGIVSLRAPC
eukprot:4647850-Prymnesium_polylepis.2